MYVYLILFIFEWLFLKIIAGTCRFKNVHTIKLKIDGNSDIKLENWNITDNTFIHLGTWILITGHRSDTNYVFHDSDSRICRCWAREIYTEFLTKSFDMSRLPVQKIHWIKLVILSHGVSYFLEISLLNNALCQTIPLFIS